MGDQNNITDVLSGNKPFLFEVRFDLKTTFILGAVLFVAVLGAVIVGKTITK
jgi:hypothetical protein